MRRLARAALSGLARVVPKGPWVSVVVDGAGALDALARRLPPGGRPPHEVAVACGPEVDLPDRAGGLPVSRAATLDDAVRAATGDYLVLVGPDEVPLPDGWRAMLGALEESRSDLVVGDLRTPLDRGWADRLFDRRRLRADPHDCPSVLVDLSTANKMFRLGFWRDAGIRLGPGPLAEAGPAAVVAAFRAAATLDVLAGVVAESTRADGALPVLEQARFRPPMLAATLRGLRRVLGTEPPGWCDLVATHLLPPLYVDAVGGGSPYATVLAEGIAEIVEGMDPAGVPLPARLGAWVARHGTLHDQALLQDLLADHPHGLPVTGGLAPLPEGLTVDVPLDWRAVQDVDRRPRVRVADRAARVGSRCRVEGASFTEYVEEMPLPDVYLEVGEDSVRLDVELRRDQGTNEWAARAFEDRSDAGWTAWFDASLLTGPGAGPWSGRQWSLRVEAAGHTSRHLVAGPPGPPGPPGSPGSPGPVSPGGTEVESVGLAAGVLTLAGSTVEPELGAVVDGPQGRTATSVLQVADGRFAGTVELSTLAFGELVRLPVGRYELRLTGAGGTPAAAAWSPELLERSPELVDDRQRVTVSGGPGPTLRVRPPLQVFERGAFAQQDLRSRLSTAGGPSYERTVLLETFRGRSVGDNPGAIGAELLRRGLGLDLAWVVDDPGVAVPDGTRAVVRRSAAWHDVLANARAYVANAGAPYWFEKRPGQIHLQTWHGTPLKRIGEDRGPGDFATWRHRRRLAAQAARWDAMLSPGTIFSDVFRSAFRYEGDLWEVGYPRNDVLLSADAGRVRARTRQRLGLEPADRAVLYAPTWRGYLGHRDSKPLFLDAEQVIGSCPDAVVLVRGHYTATTESEAFPGHPRIQDVTRYPDIAELYLAADVLVTDYSSVMFDFVLTDKPVVLLTPDLEQYREVERGFYFDLEEHSPGPLTRSTQGVVEALLGPDVGAGRRAAFRARFCPLEDGRSAAQAVDRLLELW